MNIFSGPQDLRSNKTRIAPTPSGYLHLGNVFSFVLTATLARRRGAKILLRIDDLDRQRAQPEYIQDIFDTLNFLELPWHEGPRSLLEFENEYSQVHRLPLYYKALEQLADQNSLYACECSRTQILQADPSGVYTGRCREQNLALTAPEVNWRLRTDGLTPLTVNTLTQPITTHLPHEQHDFVVRKKDALPAYQLTSVVDDIHFGVDLIVRGTDLWPSTLSQLYLAGILNTTSFTKNIFHHHSLLTTPDGDKLSKSAGATSIQYLRKEGKSAADVYTLLAAQAGIQQPVSNWETLGQALLPLQ